MSQLFKREAGLNDHMRKLERLVLQVDITANATPASKVLSSDLPSAVYVRAEGLTAAADAVESLSGVVSTPVDATGKFAVLIDTGLNPALKAYRVQVLRASTGTLAVVAQGVTAGGRIYLDLDSDQSFASTSCSFELAVDYREA
jgi:hypothetical protein